jgi:hypothetical protein
MDLWFLLLGYAFGLLTMPAVLWLMGFRSPFMRCDDE